MLPEPPGRQGSFCYPFPLGKPRRPAAEPARCRAMESVLWTQCERESLRKLELFECFGSNDDVLDQFRPQPEL
jgi:hypothetical protein